jgi:ABC-2 type transport system ATP-binding protein
MTDDYVVDVQHLNKSFNGKPAVIDLSLKVKRGEIFGFLGPNGSGKTTTIRMICGLMTPDSGSGHCLGYDIIKDSRKIKRLVGYVPQAFSLYQDMTVRENLEFVARIYEEPDCVVQVKKIIEDLDLQPYENILAGRLSGGWKQRLSLGAALIHNPKLLLLDEPTAGVDPKARREFWNYIAGLTMRGITALVSTHYMDEAERCNRLAYMVYGELMAEGTIPEIIHQIQIFTWAAHGKNIADLLLKVQSEKGVEQAVMLGNTLQISGSNNQQLEAVAKRYPDYEWKSVNTSLEAVFIHLVAMREKLKETTHG